MPPPVPNPFFKGLAWGLALSAVFWVAIYKAVR
jgi:hypothetical protein